MFREFHFPANTISINLVAKMFNSNDQDKVKIIIKHLVSN